MYQKHTNKKEAAVSPVVGVMLMLVVTIIIAAVVATMAGGMVDGQKQTPSASVGADLSSNQLVITFTGLSEPISSKDLRMTLSTTKAAEDSVGRLVSSYFSTAYTFAPENGAIVGGYSETFKPIFVDTSRQVGPAFELNATNFNTVVNRWANQSGDYWLWKGKKVTSYDYPVAAWTKLQGDAYSGLSVGGVNMFKALVEPKPQYTIEKNAGKDGKPVEGVKEYESTSVEAGDVVDITITYLPSGQPLFTKTVTVGA